MSSVRTHRAIQKLPLTHFLSIPIGHHPALRKRWTQVSRALLQSSPPIPGLHESIVLKPGSLHLTLGVLSLTSQPPHPTESAGVAPRSEQTVILDETSAAPLSAGESSASPTKPKHTIQDALLLLRSLEEPIQQILKNSTAHGDRKLRVPLELMDIMHDRSKHNPERSHVLWTGPDPDSVMGNRLKNVCDLVHSTFQNAGMLQDARPLKLHCTLINTVYRKEKAADRRRNKKRVPFSFPAILSSAAYAQIRSPTDPVDLNQSPRRVDLGSWTVDEVQVCEMGSRDADGVYRSVGAIPL